MTREMNASCAQCLGVCCGGVPSVPIVFTLSEGEADFMRLQNPQIKQVGTHPDKYSLGGTCGYGLRQPNGAIECTVYGNRKRPAACEQLKPNSKVCVTLCYRAGLL